MPCSTLWLMLRLVWTKHLKASFSLLKHWIVLGSTVLFVFFGGWEEKLGTLRAYKLHPKEEDPTST